MMRYEWDQNKNFANQKKHGISFDEAIEVFDDPLHVSVLDEKYSYFEERWITVGSTKNISIVVVVNLFFSDEGEEVIRVISAREATSNERKNYEAT